MKVEQELRELREKPKISATSAHLAEQYRLKKLEKNNKYWET